MAGILTKHEAAGVGTPDANYYARFIGNKVVAGQTPKYSLTKQKGLVLSFKGTDEERENYRLALRAERVEGKVTSSVLALWPTKEIADLMPNKPLKTIAIQVFANHDVETTDNVIGSNYKALIASINEFYPSYSWVDA